MLRYSSEDIVQIGRLTSGTSAQYIGFNKKTGKKGIYKENGCVLGIDNDDIREKLSSDILGLVGVDAAHIDLVHNQKTGQNAYFSNYIIEDNEELVAPDVTGCESDSPDPIENMCERYIQGVRKYTNDEQLIENSRKNFYRYTYICCMLDCYDIKPDNLPLVYNKDTNEFSIAHYFDFGTAFCPEHKSAPIYEMGTDEMLESLFRNDYEDIKDVVHRVSTKLTPDKISDLFASDYVTETLEQDEIDRIKTRFMSQVEKTRDMEFSKERLATKQSKGIGQFFKNIRSRIGSLFGKSKAVKLLDKQTDNNYEDKEKLARLGYSSVAEMNADDPEAEIFAHLQANTYPPQAQEDNAYQQHAREENDLTI